MPNAGIFSTLRSSDHDFIAALRFLDDYAKHIYERGSHHQTHRHFVPRFDLEQHADTYELYGELPGFRREDITIEAHDDHSLQVSGSISPITHPASDTTEPPLSDMRLESNTTYQERYLNARFGDVLDPHVNFDRGQDEAKASPEATEQVPKVRYLISERHPSVFHRAFHFPTPIKKGEVIATMHDGVLHITAPRAPALPPVKVPVKSNLGNVPVKSNLDNVPVKSDLDNVPVKDDLDNYPVVLI